MELLTPEEMTQADQITIAGGIAGYSLMQQAGLAVTQEILRVFPECDKIAILCGAGNNGGDGYVVAHLLQQAGKSVICFASARPMTTSDAAQALRDYIDHAGVVRALEEFTPKEFDLAVDGLLGAGLSREVSGVIAACIKRLNQTGMPVCAIDLPSGISGLSGQVQGAAVQADLTVTFFRKKPGHLLLPGKNYCGELCLHNIGIAGNVLEQVQPVLFENCPDLWLSLLPQDEGDTHKFKRGHVGIFSGGMMSTGAARLSAAAAARSGAGLVTMLAPADALPVHAAHLTSTMLVPLGDDVSVMEFIKGRKVRAAVLGPAFGNFERARQLTAALLQEEATEFAALILDADGITAFQNQPTDLFALARNSDHTLVLTPHEGEFQRLFGALIDDELDKVSKARKASELSAAVVVYKGADTVIAAPDGRAVINSNGSTLLATAGSGDVLTGIIAGLCAQGMPAFEAACAAVWIHAQSAQYFAKISPKGMTAEDMPDMILEVWRELYEQYELR